MTHHELIEKARSVLNPRKLSSFGAEAGGVGCALITDQGNVYTGVCIEQCSSLSLCAEHVAIGAMITAGETRIKTIVAVNWDGTVLPPCGICREMIIMVDDGNGEAEVILKDKVVTAKALLPEHWCAH